MTTSLVSGLLLLAHICSSERLFLPPNRVLSWESDNDDNTGPFFGQPEQIHLSYGGSPDSVIITWLTFNDTKTSGVQYGTNLEMENEVFANISVFIDGGVEKMQRFIHRAQIYKIVDYRVGSEYGWSSVFNFVGLKERPEGGYRYAIFGDMGNVNARSLGKIQRLAQDGDFDIIIHNGDFAYNMHEVEGRTGDEFMRQIEPAAAYVPYMTSVGNHEAAFNFSHYIERFTMPHSDHNLFYSFDVGHAHFISLSTEFYFFKEYYTIDSLRAQWNWLVQDLKEANANRRQVPWIVAFGHRSMYCTDVEAQEFRSVIRDGVDEDGAFGLEKLFYDSGVDLYIGAHEHNYERFWPLYKFQVRNGSRSAYEDPEAPVHIVTGSAGCREGVNKFPKKASPFSAARSANYGFSRMQVFNQTHLHFEQIAASEEKVEDSFWIVKRRHGPYDYNKTKHLFKMTAR